MTPRSAIPGRSPRSLHEIYGTDSYNAALQSAKMAIACAGYRVSGVGAHQASFEAIQLALGPGIVGLATYFETCRRKRNRLDYDMASITSDVEASEVLQKAGEFRDEVESWIAREHPRFAP
jgi:hypothetical protein